MAQRKAKRFILTVKEMEFIMNGIITDNLKGKCDIKKANNMAIKKAGKEHELKFSYTFRKGKRYGFVGTNLQVTLPMITKSRSLIFLAVIVSAYFFHSKYSS